MGENHFSLEGTILATDLELLRVHLHHVQVRVLPLNEVDGVGKFVDGGHGGRGKDDESGWVVSQDVKEFPGGFGVSGLAEGGGFVHEEDDVFPVDAAPVDDILPIAGFVLHDVFFFFGVGLVIKHFEGAVEVGDDQVNDLLIPATPRVDHPGVKVMVVFDALFHGCQGKLLLLVVAVPTHLDTH